MPEAKTLQRAKADRKAGKAASTQAGEFVREEMDHIREGKHGARSTQQANAGVAAAGPCASLAQLVRGGNKAAVGGPGYRILKDHGERRRGHVPDKISVSRIKIDPECRG